jgi:SAM-dependent methyltransferase
MQPYNDQFSQQAAAYRVYRPVYPPALFAWLAAPLAQRRCAWDCATGNGQAALALAEWFPEVIASDASEAQIASAQPHPRVQYRVALAEQSGLADASVELVTVAQALHWFPLARFYAEVQRVLRPGGMLAVWCYGLLQISPAVDRLIARWYRDELGPFWSDERQLVESGYRTLPFPFPELQSPAFTMTTDWTLAQLLGYLGTWSAVQEYQRQTGADPLERLQPALAGAWGEAAILRPVRWPLALRVGRSRGTAATGATTAG